jgi:hypothetical protein
MEYAMKYLKIWFPLLIIAWIVLIFMVEGFCFTALAIFLPIYLFCLAVKMFFNAFLEGELG